MTRRTLVNMLGLLCRLSRSQSAVMTTCDEMCGGGCDCYKDVEKYSRRIERIILRISKIAQED